MSNSKNAKGFVLWLMGPTSSGKTTIAERLVEMWRAEGNYILHYDGDEVRDFFGDSHGFKASDRLRVVSTLTHLAAKAADAGVNVIVSALTAHEEARAHIRNELNSLVVGYVDCPIAVCADRDPKGLYAQASRGEIETLIGVNTPYVAPENPDVVVHSSEMTIDESAEKITTHLRLAGYRL